MYVGFFFLSPWESCHSRIFQQSPGSRRPRSSSAHCRGCLSLRWLPSQYGESHSRYTPAHMQRGKICFDVGTCKASDKKFMKCLLTCAQKLTANTLRFHRATVPGEWRRSAAWHRLSPWPASTHRLHMTPWWNRGGSHTAAHTSCLCGLKIKLSTVEAPRAIDLQHSSQRLLWADKGKKKKRSRWQLFQRCRMNINAFSFQQEPIKSRAPNVAAASFLFGPALQCCLWGFEFAQTSQGN